MALRVSSASRARSATATGDQSPSPTTQRRASSRSRSGSRSPAASSPRSRSGSRVSDTDGEDVNEFSPLLKISDRRYPDELWLSESQRIVVKVIAGRNLGAFDRTGKSDPYCVVYASQSAALPSNLSNNSRLSRDSVDVLERSTVSPKKTVFRTAKRDQTLDPTWGEIFVLPLNIASNSEIIVECWDWDRVSKDDFMGEISIPVGQLRKAAGYWRDEWFPLRGRIGQKGEGRVKGDIHVAVRLVDFAEIPALLRGDAAQQLAAIQLIQDLLRGDGMGLTDNGVRGSMLMPFARPVDALGPNKDKDTISLITGRRLLGPPHTAIRVRHAIENKHCHHPMTLSAWVCIPAVSRQTYFEIVRGTDVRIAIRVRSTVEQPDLVIILGETADKTTKSSNSTSYVTVHEYAVPLQDQKFRDQASDLAATEKLPKDASRAIVPGRWAHIQVSWEPARKAATGRVVACYIDARPATSIGSRNVSIACDPICGILPITQYQVAPGKSMYVPSADSLERALTPSLGEMIVGPDALGVFVENVWLIVNRQLVDKHADNIVRLAYPAPLVSHVAAWADHSAASQAPVVRLSNTALVAAEAHQNPTGRSELLSYFPLRFSPVLQRKIVKYALILVQRGVTDEIRAGASAAVDVILDDILEMAAVLSGQVNAQASISAPFFIAGGDAILQMIVPSLLPVLLLLLRRASSASAADDLVAATLDACVCVDRIDTELLIDDVTELNFLHRASSSTARSVVAFLGRLQRRELISLFLQLLNHPNASVVAEATTALRFFTNPKDIYEIRSAMTLPMLMGLIRGGDTSDDEAALSLLSSTDCWRERPRAAPSTVERDLVRLLNQCLFPDVVFECRRLDSSAQQRAGSSLKEVAGAKEKFITVQFPAHRAICASRCDALARRIRALAPSQLSAPLFASDRSEIAKLPVVQIDASPRAFERLLQYLYTDQVEETFQSAHDSSGSVQWWQDVYALLVLADDWEMPRLRALCMDKFIRAITNDNVLAALNLLGSTPFEDVRKHCVGVFLNNRDHILYSRDVSSLDEDVSNNDSYLNQAKRGFRMIDSPLVSELASEALSEAILSFENPPQVDVNVPRSAFLDDLQYLWDHRADTSESDSANPASLADCRLMLAASAGAVFSCHRALLVARCGFFEAAFRASMLEAQTGTVVLRNLTRPAALKWLLDFVYNGVLSATTREAMCEDFRSTFELLTELEYFQVRNVPVLHDLCIKALDAAVSRSTGIALMGAGGAAPEWQFDSAALPARGVLDLTADGLTCSRGVSVADIKSGQTTGNNPVAVVRGSIERGKCDFKVRVDNVGGWIGICVVGSGVKLVDGSVIGTQKGVYNVSYFTQRNDGKLLVQPENKVHKGVLGVQDGDVIDVRVSFDNNMITFLKQGVSVGVVVSDTPIVSGMLRFGVNFGPDAQVTIMN